MAIVSTVTVGSDTFSVYSITADPSADLVSYWNGRLGATAAAVAAASSSDRKRALVMAASWMDRAVQFSGTKTVPTQALEWPRDNASCGTTPITSGTTPDNVAKAEFELAGALLVDASQADSTGQGSNVKNVHAGSASVEFFTPTINSTLDTRLPTAANDLVKCLFSGSSARAPFGSGSGSCDGSHFRDRDFERQRGYS